VAGVREKVSEGGRVEFLLFFLLLRERESFHFENFGPGATWLSHICFHVSLEPRFGKFFWLFSTTLIKKYPSTKHQISTNNPLQKLYINNVSKLSIINTIHQQCPYPCTKAITYRKAT
jgi:hypothetical protein